MRQCKSLTVQTNYLKGWVVCRPVYGDVCLKDLLGGISIFSRVLYPGPGFLSKAIWLSMLKMHYNGLINITSIISFCIFWCFFSNSIFLNVAGNFYRFIYTCILLAYLCVFLDFYFEKFGWGLLYTFHLNFYIFVVIGLHFM